MSPRDLYYSSIAGGGALSESSVLYKYFLLPVSVISRFLYYTAICPVPVVSGVTARLSLQSLTDTTLKHSTNRLNKLLNNKLQHKVR